MVNVRLNILFGFMVNEKNSPELGVAFTLKLKQEVKSQFCQFSVCFSRDSNKKPAA
jgi:hypothetical protein